MAANLPTPVAAAAAAALLLSLTLGTFLHSSLACPTCPNASPPPPPPAKPKPKPPPTSTPCPPPPHKPRPPPSPPAPAKAPQCPIDVLKLDSCVDVLGGLVHAVIGSASASKECCPAVEGLAGLDAGLCLCAAIKAKLLDVGLLLPVAVQVLVDCGKRLPADYTCPL